MDIKNDTTIKEIIEHLNKLKKEDNLTIPKFELFSDDTGKISSLCGHLEFFRVDGEYIQFKSLP